MTSLQRPIISLLVTRIFGQEEKLLLQTRTKTKDDTPYSGWLELPQGKVERGETLGAAAARELREETGMTLGPSALAELPYSRVHEDSELFVSNPLILVVDALQNHFAVALHVTAIGEPVVTPEASRHRWFSRQELVDLLRSGRLFPLNVPMVARYIESTRET